MRPVLRSRRQGLLALLIVTALPVLPAQAQKLTLKRAVQLALVHSPAMREATADAERADASFRESRDHYIPQITVGSGLGDSWGYPLSLEGSAPSLVNITAQSALFNPALQDSIRAARREYQAVLYGNQDRRSQVIQDTVLAYLELNKWEGMIDQLRQQYGDAQKMEQVAQQRIQAGVDKSQMALEAKLATARADLHVLQAEGAIQSLQATLSQLTGLPAASIQTDGTSIPAFPAVTADSEMPAKASHSNPAVLFAEQHARALSFQARAEHRALWPSVDFATQYAVLAKYNNWQQFFVSNAFQRNNASVGVVIRFPFFNSSQRAHAQSVDADAAHAAQEVQVTKNQVSEQVLKVQSSVRQLGAAREVSELEYQLAQANLNDVQIRLNSGGATVHDEANARTDVSEKYNQFQNADFELERAHVALLRATGDLEGWVGVPK